MANKKVLTWPNPKLRQASLEVSESEDCSMLLKDLYDTLNVKNGAGLAAPQIGVAKRVVIIKSSVFSSVNPDPWPDDENIWVLINPKFELAGESVKWTEGCLSIPGYTAPVVRKELVNLSYTSYDGQEKTMQVSWPLSGAVQHECGHLDGRLLLDRTTRYHRDTITKKIKKTIREKKKIRAQIKRQNMVDLHGEHHVKALERPKKIRNKNKIKMQKASRKRKKK